jgi:MFS transporter, DHA2 family, multidrug resistance protein
MASAEGSASGGSSPFSSARRKRASKSASLQGAGLGTLLPALSKAAYGTLDPKLRPEGTALFSPSRVYGGMIGIALAQMFFYTNTQSMHLALVKNQTPHRAAAHTAGAIMKSRSCRSQRCGQPQAAIVAVIDQFNILMLAMLIVGRLVLFLRKPRPVN